MRLDSSELATILAALRCWQRTTEVSSYMPEEWSIATNEGTVEPLTFEQIEALCERINMEVPAS